MATKNMSYDHPAYTAVHGVSLGSIAAGSAAQSQRFVAHAALTLKAVNYATAVLATGTSIDIKTLFIVRQGTATTTTVISTNTAVNTVVNVAVTGTGAAMSAGDYAYLQKGTDGTETGSASLEYVIQPGANVTA
jgi:hypothetical protein